MNKSVISLFFTLSLALSSSQIQSMQLFKQCYWEHKAAQLPTDIQRTGWILSELEEVLKTGVETEIHAHLPFKVDLCWDLQLKKTAPEISEQLKQLIEKYNNSSTLENQKKQANKLLRFIKRNKSEGSEKLNPLVKKAHTKALTPYFSMRYILPRVIGAAAITYLLLRYGIPYVMHSQEKTSTTDEEPSSPSPDIVDDTLPSNDEPAQVVNDSIHLSENVQVTHGLDPHQLGIKKKFRWLGEKITEPAFLEVYVGPAVDSKLSAEEKNKRYHNLGSNFTQIFSLNNQHRSPTFSIPNSGKLSIVYKYIFRIPPKTIEDLPWPFSVLLSDRKNKIVGSDTTWSEFTLTSDQVPKVVHTFWDTEKRDKPCMTFENMQPDNYGHAGYVDGNGKKSTQQFYAASILDYLLNLLEIKE